MGKKLTDLHFTNRLLKKCPFLFTKVTPAPLSNPQFLHLNSDLLQRLELNSEKASAPSFLRFCNGDLEFEGVEYSASVYAGHQFGHFVPQLGDGRALMIGEIETAEDHYELQLKGSGLTPYSRMGDGRAVVRSSIREYLASAHMLALNIPTTEALSLISGDDVVYRERAEKGAIVMRVAESFLRFGHFEFFSRNEEQLKSLVNFTIDHYFSEYKDHPNKLNLFFQDVVKKTAKLFAKWQSVGFAHGVLNTDNTSILGLTIDYGPYGFLEILDMDYICNHSDHEGRYSFGNQPSIGLWNLTRLGEALSGLISEEDRERTLKTYAPLFHMEYLSQLREKCGLYTSQAGDEELMRALLNVLVATKVDYTNFFRKLSHRPQHDDRLFHESGESLISWLKDYDQRLNLETMGKENRQQRMLKTNPKFILRNYLAQMAIDDHELIAPLFKVLTNPFDEWSEYETWSEPTPAKYQSISVSCSS